MGWQLREYVADDLPQVVALEQRIFVQDAWSPEMVRSDVEAKHTRYCVGVDGASADGALVGYAGLSVRGDDGDVQTIAVAPEARGKGLGKAMFRQLLSWAEAAAVRQVFLEVDSSNHVAKELYLAHGFEPIAIRPTYYSSGADAIVMRLQRKNRENRKDHRESA